MKYQSDLDAAKENREKLEQTFKRLKKKRPKQLDDIFEQAHDNAFSSIDCLSCANCCKTTSPIFRDIDIKRISKKMKMPVANFELDYLKVDEDGDWVLKSSPCPFLATDNTCGIYDFRPQACSEYPHTNRKKMSQILDLTLTNTEICPAAARISIEVVNKFL